MSENKDQSCTAPIEQSIIFSVFNFTFWYWISVLGSLTEGRRQLKMA